MGTVQIAVPTNAAVDESVVLVTKLGGLPAWPDNVDGWKNPGCKTCHETLPLLCQVHAPAPGANERVIYVFACGKADCSAGADGWVVLRLRRSDAASKDPAERNGHETRECSASFGEVSENVDDWGASDWNNETLVESEDIEELLQLQKLRLGEVQSNKEAKKAAYMSTPDPPNKKREADGRIPCRRCVALEWQDEPQKQGLSKEEQAKIAKLIQNYEKEEEQQDAGESTEQFQEEDYEKDNLSEQNRSFQKMMKRVNREPRQCIRYCYGDEVLYVSGDEEDLSVGNCEICGCQRIAEMQLLSSVIYLTGEEVLVGGMDWGTSIIYTCAADCNIDGRLCQEQVYVKAF
mmetsp:Transcript_2947/g.9027  ORF Transcript_2947/g.9027 Transcript_2947/m.9027 type:complete len:348 (-) Transcript_2947:529-1572(-)